MPVSNEALSSIQADFAAHVGGDDTWPPCRRCTDLRSCITVDQISRELVEAGLVTREECYECGHAAHFEPCVAVLATGTTFGYVKIDKKGKRAPDRYSEFIPDTCQCGAPEMVKLR